MKKSILPVALAIILSASIVPSQACADEVEPQKAVLVTGASTGIGRNAAERLASAGYFVYAGARKASDMEQLNQIDNIMAVRLDVTKQDEIDAAVELIRSEGRGLWGIVNNAGVNVVAPLIEADISEVEFLFDVNVFGVFRVTKAFAPLVIESQGRIVNISSISGFLSGGGYGIYSASKHAVEAFTDSLAAEMDDLNVFVAAVEPGNFASEIGLTRCKRRLADTDAQPYVYFEDRRQQLLASCQERVDAGIEEEGIPPDAVAVVIEHALFDDNPKRKYLIVPEQREAGWTITTVMNELLSLNGRHDYSYSRDELVELLDAIWPFGAGEKSYDDDDENAEIRAFMRVWMSRQGRADDNQGQ
jgi:NAD(P)-dependent dehydrogenase (short-subunit alcohol dehydrogenase family)